MNATKRISPFPEEWEEQARTLFPAYILYDRDYFTREKIGFCSRCGHRFSAGLKRTEAPSDPDVIFRQSVHNERIVCPECGANAIMKARGKFRSKTLKSLAGNVRAVFAQKITPAHVRLRAFYIEYGFQDWNDIMPELDFFEDFCMDLEPGKVTARRKTPWTEDRWEPCGLREPWNVMNAYNPHMDMSYELFPEDLEGTFLGWLPLGQMRYWDWTHLTSFGNYVANIPWCKLLGWAAIHPSVEMVAKLGGTELIFDLCFEGRKNARYVNWNARRITDFLKIPREYAKAVAMDGMDLDVIKMIKDLGIDFETASRWRRRGWSPYTVQSEGIETVRYLDKQKCGCGDLHLLKDYRREAEFLGRDMSVPSIFWPKDLRAAHDEAARSADRIRKERQAKKSKKKQKSYFTELYPKLRMRYEWQDGKYIAMIPERLEDIALEGRNQHHCVGGYVDRHAAGVLVIVFIRRVMAPMIPLWTVELATDGSMKQIQGFHNEEENRPQGEDAEWVENWLRIVKRRIKDEERTAANG